MLVLEKINRTLKGKILLLCSICIFSVFPFVQCASKINKNQAPYIYEVASIKWNEPLGNHRAVLRINKPANVVRLTLNWRRPDKDVDKRRFLIINAESGDTIKNIQRLEVNNTSCNLLFGPVVQKGLYYFYYLPYKIQEGCGWFYGNYEKQEESPSPEWCSSINEKSHIEEAQIVRIEARTKFDSFYPMEVISTPNECSKFISKYPSKFWVFPEDRKTPIVMKNYLPYKWTHNRYNCKYSGAALKNEYFTFQLGIWAGNGNIENIQYETKGLFSKSGIISPKSITCFNLEGINTSGKPFTKRVDVNNGVIQPLWFGIDISENQPSGTYTGEIVIYDEHGNKVPVKIELKVEDEIIHDRGDAELWRHSRLRWLNSTLGIADKPTCGYEDMTANKNIISCLGRTIELDSKTALPKSIMSWNNEILSNPISFEIKTNKGVKKLNGKLSIDSVKKSVVSFSYKAEDDELIVTAKGSMEFDGYVNYNYSLHAKQDLEIIDICLNLPLNKNTSKYFMGIGLPAQSTPAHYISKWDLTNSKREGAEVSIPISERRDVLWPFDSFWCGSANAGLHLEFRGSSYSGPLLNVYRPQFPESWHNNGKGGFEINSDKTTDIKAYSGARKLAKNSDLSFEFSFFITPVKKTNFKNHFTNRYYHSPYTPAATMDNIKKDGVRVINIHPANYLNPLINYPFVAVDTVKNYVEKWHAHDCKVKLYYTIRELTNVASEFWALRSLGNEIFADGEGGGYPWLREHLVANYTPQWYQHLDRSNMNITADAAILTAPGDSRWYNYYIEGLAWMIKNMDIDGIYLDDVSYGRDILQRMRRAMESIKPDCMIDLHSNTWFSKGPAIQYTEFFPYIDKLWFGESFLYNEMSPENWLVEVSGIPFGLTGDMLQGGGNQWLGMQYGMTVRQAWETGNVVCDPSNVWHFWDKFGIQDAKVMGFWMDDPIISTNQDDVKATTFVKKNEVLVSIGNYSKENKNIYLNVDWKRINMNPSTTTIEVPEIQNFQKKRTIKLNDPIYVEAKKGLLLILRDHSTTK